MFNNITILKHSGNTPMPALEDILNSESELNERLNNLLVGDLYANDTDKIGTILNYDTARMATCIGNKLVFTIAVNQKKISKKQVNFLVAKESKGKELTKDELKDLKTKCMDSVIERTIPITELYDVAIDYDTGFIYTTIKSKDDLDFLRNVLTNEFELTDIVDFHELPELAEVNLLHKVLAKATDAYELTKLQVNEYSTDKTITFNTVDISNIEGVAEIGNKLSEYDVKSIKIKLNDELEFAINSKYQISGIKSLIEVEEETELGVIGNLTIALNDVDKIIDYLLKD